MLTFPKVVERLYDFMILQTTKCICFIWKLSLQIYLRQTEVLYCKAVWAHYHVVFMGKLRVCYDDILKYLLNATSYKGSKLHIMLSLYHSGKAGITNCSSHEGYGKKSSSYPVLQLLYLLSSGVGRKACCQILSWQQYLFFMAWLYLG